MSDIASSDQPTILVPLDGSSLAEQAIPYASVLGRASGRLLFLQVTLDPEPVYGLLGDRVQSKQEVAEGNRAAAQRELEQIAARWAEVTPNVEIEIASGDPAEHILRVAQERGCEMIALATHGRGAVGRWTFGSVADRIARTSTVPVLLVRPHDARPVIGPALLRRLVVPLDGSEQAMEALPIASRLASRLELQVHLLQAINPAAMLTPYPGMEATYPAEIIAELDDEMVAGAQSTLDEGARPLRDAGITVTTAVEHGEPATAIDAATKDGDLVVMTSHGRSGVRRWLLGSVAEKLVRNGSAPVILVPTAARAERD